MSSRPTRSSCGRAARSSRTERGEHLFARGVTDMKGQVLAAIKAVESIIRTGKLPINVKFLIEGEEEIGSPSLDAFLERNRELLACDLVLNPDAGILGPDTPTIAYGLRGLAYFELRVYGPDHDLHSGVFGGAVHNPAQALCELIAGMHDDQGRITLPGFYDAVRPLDAEGTRSSWPACPPRRPPSSTRPAPRRCGARPVIPPWNAWGRGPHWRCTACCQASPAQARKPCCRPGPWPRSPAAWYPIKTPKKSTSSSSATCRPTPPPPSAGK